MNKKKYKSPSDPKPRLGFYWINMTCKHCDFVSLGYRDYIGDGLVRAGLKSVCDCFEEAGWRLVDTEEK